MTAETEATWALSPLDYQAHAVIDEHVDDDTAALVARCGHTMPTAVGLDTVPRASLCPRCVRTLCPVDLGGRGGPC